MAAASMHQVQSYVMGSNYEGILSRFADVQCELLMTVGRTPSTAMPPEWSASGAKLGLRLNIKFSTETCESYEMNQGTLLGGALPSSSFLVQPLNEPSFVSVNGQETVKVTPGRFSCQLDPQTEQYSFRFFLDFPEGAVRNDVTLPAERIYFMTACWNEDDDVIGRAKRFKDHIVRSLQQINSEIEEMEQHPIGSLQKALGLRKYFVLLERRKKLAGQVGMLEETFPPHDRLITAPNNIVFLKEGVIAVKRLRGAEEQYHWVGTFKIKDFLNNATI